MEIEIKTCKTSISTFKIRTWGRVYGKRKWFVWFHFDITILGRTSGISIYKPT